MSMRLVNYLQYGLSQGDDSFVAEYIHQKGRHVNLSGDYTFDTPFPWTNFCGEISHFDPFSE